jgi:hypothetical protein
VTPRLRRQAFQFEIHTFHFGKTWNGRLAEMPESTSMRGSISAQAQDSSKIAPETESERTPTADGTARAF